MPADDNSAQMRVALFATDELGAQLAAGLTEARLAVIGPGRPAADASYLAIPSELQTEADVDAALAKATDSLGGLDQIVHAWYPTTVLHARDFTELDEQAWAAGCERALEVGWWVARHALQRLRPTSGSMVFLVPTVGMSGAAGFSMMAAAAEGLRVLAKGCGRQWGAHGVTANTVAVAPHLLLGAQIGADLSRAVSLSAPALGGPGDPAQDIAAVIRMLGTSDAHFLTASTLVADGGLWMGL